MRRKAFESESGPATLGSTAKAHLILHVWCWVVGTGSICVDPAERPSAHGADLPVPDWTARLAFSCCGGSRNVDFVVTPGRTGGVGS